MTENQARMMELSAKYQQFKQVGITDIPSSMLLGHLGRIRFHQNGIFPDSEGLRWLKGPMLVGYKREAGIAGFDNRRARRYIRDTYGANNEN